MTQSFLIYAPKIIFDFLFDVTYFLPWWYSKGMLKVLKSSWNFLVDKESELAILVWLKNIHKPLTENYNWLGMVKSVLKRIVQIVVRSVILLFWVIVMGVKVVVYLALPVLVAWQVIYQAI